MLSRRAKEALDDFAAEQGWNLDSQIHILSDFIDSMVIANRIKHDDFEKCLKIRQEEENLLSAMDDFPSSADFDDCPDPDFDRESDEDFDHREIENDHFDLF